MKLTPEQKISKLQALATRYKKISISQKKRLDMLEAAQVHKTYLTESPVMTINEVRAELGKTPVPWGDGIVIPWSNAQTSIVSPEDLSSGSKQGNVKSDKNNKKENDLEE